MNRNHRDERQTQLTQLRAVGRRRFELLGIMSFLLLAATGVTVGLTFTDRTAEWFDGFGGTLAMARIALVAIAVSFVAYLVEKERQLQRATADLVAQRVRTAALDARLQQIFAIGEAGQRVTATPDLESVMPLILDAAFDLMEADDGSVMLAEGNNLVVAATHGKRETMLVGERVRSGEGIAGRVAATGAGMLIGDPYDGVAPEDLRRPEEIVSAMSVPLSQNGSVIGVLNLNRTSGTPYNEEDLRAFELFAGHAAAGLWNARLLRNEHLRSELITSAARQLETSLAAISGTMNGLRGTDLAIEQEHADAFREIERRTRDLRAITERMVEQG